MTFAVANDREGGFTVLRATDTDVDGELSVNHDLPSGFGDLWIVGFSVDAQQIATIMANPEVARPKVGIRTGAGARVEFLPMQNYAVQGPAEVHSVSLQNTRLVFMRSDELINIQGPELDTNGAPTVDYEYMMVVLRRRNIRGW